MQIYALKKSLLISFMLIAFSCTYGFAQDNSRCNLNSFPNNFTALEDEELQTGDLLGNEAGISEFKGCTKTIYGKKNQQLPRHIVYHLGQKVVAYKATFASDILSHKIDYSGVKFHGTLLFLMKAPRWLKGPKMNDFSKDEILALETFALQMENLRTGEKTGITIREDLRIIASRRSETVELEFLPLKTFLDFKRAGLR